MRLSELRQIPLYTPQLDKKQKLTFFDSMPLFDVALNEAIPVFHDSTHRMNVKEWVSLLSDTYRHSQSLEQLAIAMYNLTVFDISEIRL